jgi:sensor c-di-GMP phosphodiesterase-like protein
MTYWVIDTVAAEMGEWLRANPEACISMNVPPEVLGRGGLEYAATKSGLRDVAGQIILEITERGIPDLLGVQALNLMPGSGVRVALDDVTLLGGGQLAVLARCNFNIIKIDISLVAQISAQSPHPEWLDGLTAVLESTQLTVIAEGVETEQQLATLRKARVQWAQGFHFSRAIPAAEFIAFHRDFRA